MIESSLTHLTAVSGSNCALVVTGITAIVARLGLGRRLRILLAGAALGCFVVLVGPDASVQRAAVMATVLLVSRFGGKRGQTLPALGLAVIVLLLADPWQSIQPGFALSVTATAGILLWASPLERWLRARARLPRVLALPLAVAAVAQFACAPLLLLLQPGIPVGGVLANLLAAPAAPAGTALGMAALLALPLSTWIGGVLLAGATWPARWIEAAGVVGVSVPGGRWFWPGGWGGALLLAAIYALLGVAWAVASGWAGTHAGARQPWEQASRSRGPAWTRALGGGAAALAAGVALGIVVVVPAGVRIGVPRDWFAVACDVGQGDAVLLRDPRHPERVMLVDTGEHDDMLEACLTLFGVRQIELLVLTHNDRDHVGSKSVVLPMTSAVLVAPASREDEGGLTLEQAVLAAGANVSVGRVGDRGGAAGSLRWQVLAPAPARSYPTANATSLVLLVEAGGVRTLLLADTGDREQRALMRTHPNLSADVVKVAHHGSRNQAPGMYDSVGARLGLISVGERNTYGHPNQALLDSLAAAGTQPLRTDELGSVALRQTPSGIEVWAAGARSAVLQGAAPAGRASVTERAETLHDSPSRPGLAARTGDRGGARLARVDPSVRRSR